MKIIILNYEFPPLGGGAGNATYHILKEFKKYPDIEIEFITSSSKKEGGKEKFSKNINVHFLNIGKKGDLHHQSNKDLLLYSAKAYRKTREIIGQQNIDLIHAFFGVPCGYIAMQMKKPYIVSLRGSDVPFHNKRFYWLDKLFLKNLSRKIWKNSDAVIANSKGLKDSAQQSAPEQAIDVIPNGVDIDTFSPSEAPQKMPRILTVTRLAEGKRIELLIRAINIVRKKIPDVQLVIAGSGKYKNELEKLTNKENLSEKVTFLGSVPHNQLVKVYRSASLFVLPSKNEGMSNTVLEAMACGLPLVVSDAGGMQELCQGNGIKLSDVSEASLAQAIEKIINAPATEIETYRKRSRQMAETHSWNEVALSYKNLYQKVLDGRVKTETIFP